MQKAGASVTSSVSGKTTILVCQDTATATGNNLKAQAARARARGIRIMTRDEAEAALGMEDGLAPAKQGAIFGAAKRASAKSAKAKLTT